MQLKLNFIDIAYFRCKLDMKGDENVVYTQKYSRQNTEEISTTIAVLVLPLLMWSKLVFRGQRCGVAS